MKKRKSYNYFTELEKLSHFSYEEAVFLRKALSDFNQVAFGQQAVELHQIEHEADLRKQDMMVRMAKEFMTPIDREDIIDLAQSLDNVTNKVEDVMMKIHVLNVSKLRGEAIDFSELIVSCCAAVKESMKEFHRFNKSEKLHIALKEVHGLEEEADALYAKAIKVLYRTCRDPVELLVWTQIFDWMEECCDACDVVADVIESVVMKNT